MADSRAQSTVGARREVLAADQPALAHRTFGDQLGMLDEVTTMAGPARDQLFPGRELDLFMHAHDLPAPE